MSDWMPMKTAPRDGTQIELMVDGAIYVCAWFGGLVGADDEDCATWRIVSWEEPPESWDDGICWGSNAEGNSSTQPTAWKPLT